MARKKRPHFTIRALPSGTLLVCDEENLRRYHDVLREQIKDCISTVIMTRDQIVHARKR